jgi:hypothetical protein
MLFILKTHSNTTVQLSVQNIFNIPEQRLIKDILKKSNPRKIEAGIWKITRSLTLQIPGINITSIIAGKSTTPQQHCGVVDFKFQNSFTKQSFEEYFL